ncbi:MAG: peptide deformylase [Chloroflexi bacterium]|nr:peptide deformylase [Chloroflexota bacterium]
MTFATDFALRVVPDPVLRLTAEEVAQNGSAALLAFAQGLEEARIRYQGIGIAAPQVGVSRRVVAICIPAYDRVGFGPVPETPLTYLVNPHLVWASPETIRAPEGCLSVPGYEGVLSRPARVVVAGLGLTGEPVRLEAGGLLAKCLQHELDHLDGILYVDRIQALRDLRRIAPVDADDPVLERNRFVGCPHPDPFDKLRAGSLPEGEGTAPSPWPSPKTGRGR